MISLTTLRFRKAYSTLPPHIQEQTRKNYRLWKEEPHHPSLQFKQVHNEKPIFSVRIGLSYRAVGLKEQDTMIWFWIGSHADYDNLIAQL